MVMNDIDKHFKRMQAYERQLMLEDRLRRKRERQPTWQEEERNLDVDSSHGGFFSTNPAFRERKALQGGNSGMFGQQNPFFDGSCNDKPTSSIDCIRRNQRRRLI